MSLSDPFGIRFDHNASRDITIEKTNKTVLRPDIIQLKQDNSAPAKKIFPDILLMVIVFTAYFIIGKLGLKLAFENISSTAVWAPTGIALAVFLLRGYRLWPAILLGAFLINITTTGDIPTSAFISLGNTAEGLIGAFLVNRYAGGINVFNKAGDIFRFILLAGVLSTLIS